MTLGLSAVRADQDGVGAKDELGSSSGRNQEERPRGVKAWALEGAPTGAFYPSDAEMEAQPRWCRPSGLQTQVGRSPPPPLRKPLLTKPIESQNLHRACGANLLLTRTEEARREALSSRQVLSLHGSLLPSLRGVLPGDFALCPPDGA